MQKINITKTIFLEIIKVFMLVMELDGFGFGQMINQTIQPIIHPLQQMLQWVRKKIPLMLRKDNFVFIVIENFH